MTDRFHGEHRYKSVPVQNNAKGFSGLELHRLCDDRADCVARVIFWDACGQFFVETCGTDVPLEIFEELIKEAKGAIRHG